MLVALAIFATAYVLISLPQTRIPAPRWAIALAGGGAMVLAGVLSPVDAWRAQNWGVLALLLGMMLLVAGLDVAGFFHSLAAVLTRVATTPRRLLIAVAIATAVLSAIALNDAVVLLFTPVVVEAARRLRANPAPFLIIEACAANIGSVATPIGNPQNAAIAVMSGADFVPFFLALAPVALVSLAVLVAWGLVFFNRDLRAAPQADGDPAREAVVAAPANPRLLTPVTIISALVLSGFLFAGILPFPAPIPLVALAGGALLLGVTWPATRTAPIVLLKRVNWGILAFFAGLFILVAGFRAAGLGRALESLLPAADTARGLAASSAVLSNIVSNVPAVLLLADTARTMTDWFILSASSTLAGNATLLGSAATIIVAEAARANGARLDVLRFIAFGLPLAIITVTVSVTMLAL